MGRLLQVRSQIGTFKARIDAGQKSASGPLRCWQDPCVAHVPEAGFSGASRTTSTVCRLHVHLILFPTGLTLHQIRIHMGVCGCESEGRTNRKTSGSPVSRNERKTCPSFAESVRAAFL